jgi:hypothetical protein
MSLEAISAAYLTLVNHSSLGNSTPDMTLMPEPIAVKSRMFIMPLSSSQWHNSLIPSIGNTNTEASHMIITLITYGRNIV